MWKYSEQRSYRSWGHRLNPKLLNHTSYVHLQMLIEAFWVAECPLPSPFFSPEKKGGRFAYRTKKEWCSIKKYRGGGDLLAEEAEVCLWLTAPHSKAWASSQDPSLWVWTSAGCISLPLSSLLLLTLFLSILSGFHPTAQGTQHFTWSIKYSKTESWETRQGLDKRGWRKRRERVEKG